MGLLLDTNILVWLVTGDKRLSETAREAIFYPGNRALISAATACEYVELNARGRFGSDLPFLDALHLVEGAVLPLPPAIWEIIITLPRLHQDPIDRMVVAHAIHADLTLITSDKTMRSYPVTTIW